MTYEYVKYSDGTLCVFSNIGKKEDGEEYLRVTFERPKEYGFDTVVFELPNCKVVLRQGHYTDEEIALFQTVVERGEKSFFQWAREGGIHISH